MDRERKGDRAGGQPGRQRAGGDDKLRASLRFLESQYLTAELQQAGPDLGTAVTSPQNTTGAEVTFDARGSHY
jgi:hypothetical protein